VDGIFVAGVRTDDPYIDELKEQFIPAVFMDYPMVGKKTSWVESDNAKGCRLAIDYLVTRGHQRIAFINGHQQAAVSAVRLEGYRQALRKNGLAYNGTLVESSVYTEKSGYDAARRMLAGKTKFSAIFAASDLIALGAIRALAAAKIAVPRDVAVIGFDDILLAEYSHPRLTTVRQHMFDIGYEGAKELHRIMEQPGHVPAKRTVDVELVIRESA
jgi:LacI family transcriptional regulator